MPAAGSPKKMKNSCTMNGVLRMISTYAPTSQSAHVGPKARADAPTVPSATPAMVETTVSTMVKIRPCSSTSQ